MTTLINIVGFPFLQLSTEQVAEMLENQNTPLRLKAEPENTFDSGAIAVYRGFNRIAYVAKDSQYKIKDKLDEQLTLFLDTKFPRSIKVRVEFQENPEQKD